MIGPNWPTGGTGVHGLARTVCGEVAPGGGMGIFETYKYNLQAGASVWGVGLVRSSSYSMSV